MPHTYTSAPPGGKVARSFYWGVNLPDTAVRGRNRTRAIWSRNEYGPTMSLRWLDKYKLAAESELDRNEWKNFTFKITEISNSNRLMSLFKTGHIVLLERWLFTSCQWDSPCGFLLRLWINMQLLTLRNKSPELQTGTLPFSNLTAHFTEYIFSRYQITHCLWMWTALIFYKICLHLSSRLFAEISEK